MKDQIRSLVREGLYLQNLIKLLEICNACFDENPALYGPIGCIFQSLAEEYNDQAIPQEHYQLIMRSLQTPILALLDAETASAETFLDRLTDVLRASRGLAS